MSSNSVTPYIDPMLEGVDVKDKILVITCPEEKVGDIARILEEASVALSEAGCVFTLVVDEEIKISTLDEKEMNSYGWYKRKENKE